MKKKKVFLKIAKGQLNFLAVEVVTAYIVTMLVVKGNGMIAGAIDQLLAGKAKGIINSSFIVQLLLLVVLGFVFSFIRDMAASSFSVNVQKGFRYEAGRKLLHLEFKYFDENGSGTILHKLISDIQAAGYFFSEILPSICIILVEIATISISILKMDMMLVAFIAIGYPVVIVLSHIASKRLGKLAEKRWDKIDGLNDRAYDHMQGIIVGRSFNLMPVMEKRINEANGDILDYEFKRNRLSVIPWMISNIISWMPNILLAVLALIRVLSGQLTVGEMTYFVLMLDRIIHPLSELPSLFMEMRELGVSINRLEEIMAQSDEPSGMGMIHTVEEKAGSREIISFKQVDFGYTDENPVLKDVDFNIYEGQHIAFVGGSGEGKSTIFKLLCGFYKKRGGSYKLFGKDFSKWQLESAREQFSLVSQNVFLFPGTIAENIGYGKKGASLEEIKKACQLANIHDFIMSLPDQYETVVGERGARLSGGEKQRLSIARAFLKDAPILLLDEPTSAIDVGTETLIKEAIERISKGKTVLTIAHRLSTIENADMILVLSGGKIVERGKSEQLLAEEGVYYQLYEMQRQAS